MSVADQGTIIVYPDPPTFTVNLTGGGGDDGGGDGGDGGDGDDGGG